MREELEAVMANAVVAVFNDYNEAQSTVNELLVAGFDKNEIKLSGEDGKTTVTEEERPRGRGVKGFFKSLFGTEQEDYDVRLYDEAVRHGNYVVTAIAPTEEKSDIASEVMSHHHPVDIEERSSEWLGQSTGAPRSGTISESRAIPVIEEEVKIGKREVSKGGVRIFQRVSEVPVEEDVTLREEHVVVERVPVNKPASEADLSAFKEGSAELRERAEEAVVSKTARVVEEVRVGKEVTEKKQKVKETARRTDVEVERTGDDDYRAHWQQNYGSQGGRYEEYLPAYEYGSTAAGSRQFKGRQWDEVEPDLRRDWEARYPGTAWERFKDSVRHAFSRRP
jgi:uncharacterized protein (TIGR02271 family)